MKGKMLSILRRLHPVTGAECDSILMSGRIFASSKVVP